jgi:hypothetical protein
MNARIAERFASIKRNGRAAFVAFVAFLGACGQANAELPGSAEFPLVEGSSAAECPEADQGTNAVCVSMPNDAHGRAVVETYQRQLHERGFRFARYLSSPSVVMLVKPDGDGCDVMVFGLPYLPPEERTALLLEFQTLDRISVEACEGLQREGQR